MPKLTQAYLTWKYKLSDRTSADLSGPCGENEYDFDIEVIDLHTFSSSIHIQCTEDMKTPEALVLSGYLGTSPVSLTLALLIQSIIQCRGLHKGFV